MSTTNFQLRREREQALGYAELILTRVVPSVYVESQRAQYHQRYALTGRTATTAEIVAALSDLVSALRAEP